MPQRKINLKLYDVDGCLFHIFQNMVPETPVERWLLESNENFLREEISQINEETFDLVIISYGTNRQDYAHDELNARSSHSCAPILPILQSYFSPRVNARVVLDPFLMADVYNDVTAGTSYEMMLNEIYNGNTQKHCRWIFDDTKPTIIYANAHRTACLNPDAQSIIIDFIDDRVDILQFLLDFYSNAPDLLPWNVTLRFHQYFGGDIQHYSKHVQGTGVIDKNYQWSVRLLAIYSFKFDSEDNNFVRDVLSDRNIDTKEQLLKFYTDQRQFHPSYTYLAFNAMFNNDDLQKFREMRAKQISKFVPQDFYTQPTYQTASDLVSQGLIPAVFIIPQDYQFPIKVEEDDSEVELLLKSQHEDSSMDFVVTEQAQQRIMDEISNYIRARGEINGKEIKLNWLSRYFRNPELTNAKVSLARDFMEAVKVTSNYANLQRLVVKNKLLHDKLENKFNKKYSIFTRSGLTRNLNNISKMLESENLSSSHSRELKKF
jgi:hypothetical protein